MGANDYPMSGGIPYAIGQSSIVRIPIPGTDGLCIELNPRGWVPKGGSTSTLFFQDMTGKRHLRLDYGYNIASKTIDFHWNQAKTFSTFGIQDHTTVGRVGRAVYRAAKYFKYAGRVLLVTGIAIDLISITRASKPIKRAADVVVGWAAAWVGCETVGAGGAAIGSFASPIGTAIGGFSGCIIGGIGGYYGGSSIGGRVYDWTEGTQFIKLIEIKKA